MRDFGFSPVVGNISLPQTEDQMYGQKPYSDALANIIDTEARKMIFQAYKQTETIIKENKGKLGIVSMIIATLLINISLLINIIFLKYNDRKLRLYSQNPNHISET